MSSSEIVNNIFDSKVFLMLCSVGILVKLFFGKNISKSGNTGPASAVIWGYGAAVLSLLGLLIVSSSLGTHKEYNNPLGGVYPFFITIII